MPVRMLHAYHVVAAVFPAAPYLPDGLEQPLGGCTDGEALGKSSCSVGMRHSEVAQHHRGFDEL